MCIDLWTPTQQNLKITFVDIKIYSSADKHNTLCETNINDFTVTENVFDIQRKF